MDAFDKAFLGCTAEEQELILSMTAEEFARDLLRTFKKTSEESD